jgi:hypothetical protein
MVVILTAIHPVASLATVHTVLAWTASHHIVTPTPLPHGSIATHAIVARVTIEPVAMLTALEMIVAYAAK